MSRSVGVRELKNQASRILAEVRGGDSVTITDRGRPVAQIIPFPRTSVEDRLRGLVTRGEATWSGGLPEGSTTPALYEGPSVADAILEDRE